MKELIRKNSGDKIYLRFAHGFKNESLRKIGWSEDIEKRLKSYKSHGDLSENIVERHGDGVDEQIFHSYFQSDCYKHLKYKTIKRLKDTFCNKIFNLDNIFGEISSSEIHCNVFDKFIDLIYHGSSDKKLNLLYDLTNSGKFDFRGLGLELSTDIHDIYDIPLDDWLDTDPGTFRSVGFWRSILYKFGNDYKGIIDKVYNEADKCWDKRGIYPNIADVQRLYNSVGNKLGRIMRCKELVDLPEDIKLEVCDLVLSYFCAKNTKNTDIRKEIRKEIDDILNTQRSGH